MLDKIKQKATSDIELIKPYVAAFSDKNVGGGYGMPMVIMTFGYPLSLVELIEKNIDESGLVTGLNPKQRQDLKQLTNNNVSELERAGASSPAP
jgi:hypothetical protein